MTTTHSCRYKSARVAWDCRIRRLYEFVLGRGHTAASSGHSSSKHSRTFAACRLAFFLLKPLEVADGHVEWRTFIDEYSVDNDNRTHIWCSVVKYNFHFMATICTMP